MYRKLVTVSLIISSLITASCHKSGGTGNPAALVGNWQFVYMSYNTQASSIGVGTGIAAGENTKSFSSCNYKTIQNTGTITFTKDSVYWKSICYSSDYYLKGYSYTDGKLTDSFNNRNLVSYISGDTTSRYNALGRDSLSFSTSYMVPWFGGNKIAFNRIYGCRYSFKGDTLFLSTNAQETDPPQTIGNFTFTSSTSGTSVMALLKQ